MYCKNCGAEIKEGQKFCGKCGAPTDGNEGQPQPPKTNKNEPAPLPKRQTGTTVALIATAVIILAVIILFAVLRSGNSTDEVPEDEPTQDEVEAPTTDETPAPTGSLEDSVRISDVQVETIRYSDEWDWLVEEGYENLLEYRQLGTATLYNNSDTDCTVTLSFEYQVTSVDNYGDPVEEIQNEEHEFDIAAKDTVQVECLLDHSGAEDATGEESTYTYTGQAALTNVTAYTGDAKLLPLTSITHTEMTNNGGTLGEDQGIEIESESSDDETQVVNDHANILFTIPNQTEDRWESCYVHFDVYYDGVFVGTGGNYWWSTGFLNSGSDWNAKDAYIKPGEEAVAMEDFGSSAFVDTNKISLVVKKIDYYADTANAGTEN